MHGETNFNAKSWGDDVYSKNVDILVATLLNVDLFKYLYECIVAGIQLEEL